MRRIIMMVLNNILLVPFMSLKLFYYANHVEKYTDEQHYKLLKYIVYRANKGGNINIEVYGKENIPKENGFILFPNHQGMYDVLAIIESCPIPFSVVYKKEVQNIPFLKQVFQCMRAFSIDREDVRQSMKVIFSVANEVVNGRNYLIFPEGTRSKAGNQVGEFKGGSFKAATKSKCPIVPVALIDCYKPFDTNTIKHTDIQVHYLEPIYYSEYKEMKTVEIAEEVKRRIVREIEKSKKGVDN